MTWWLPVLAQAAIWKPKNMQDYFLRQNQSSQQAGPSPSLPRQLTLEMSRQVCRAFGTAPHGAPENVRSFSEPPRLYVEDDTAVSCHYQPGRGSNPAFNRHSGRHGCPVLSSFPGIPSCVGKPSESWNKTENTAYLTEDSCFIN